MISVWTRRMALALICGPAVLLASCGSSSIVGAIKPTRFISVGDGFSDVGQNGYRYTINDGTMEWTQQLAANYNLTLTAASAGGWSYAQGHANVATPDTTSGANAPSVQSQIDTMLARVTFTNTDIVLVSGGISDIVNAVNATGVSSSATVNTVTDAGTALGGQVRRLVNAGATHVVVSGVYDMGISPWARGLGQSDAITNLSTDFNNALLLSIVDLGANVLYVDPALFYNLIYNQQSLTNVTDPVCTTPDATTCTANTIVSGADITQYLFADNLYFTPYALRLFATDSYNQNAYTRLVDRW